MAGAGGGLGPAAGGLRPDGLANAQALFNRYQTDSTAPNIFRMGPGGSNANVNFPVQIGSTDPQDFQYALQKELVNTQGIVPGVGQALVGPEYFEYATRKDQQQQLLNYRQFAMQQADLSTPEKTAWWFEKFPWMAKDRTDLIDSVSELQKKFAHMQVRGIQSEEDMLLSYLEHSGYIKVPKEPVHLLGTNESLIAGSYQAGFFSPLVKPIPAFAPNRNENKIHWNNPIGKPMGRGSFSGPTPVSNVNQLVRPS